MKFLRALYILTTALTVAATESNLRGKDETPKGKVLARVEVTPTATVDMLLLEKEEVVILSAKADPASAKTLEKVLEDAEEDEDDDIVSFYKKISGKEEVPSELAKFADRAETMALKLDSQDDPFGLPPSEDGVTHIDDLKTVVEHDGDDDDEDDGNERSLSFCYGYRSCGCYTYITGNYETTTKRGTQMWSHLNPYRGCLRHSIYVWNGYWSRVISRYVCSGYISKIRGWDTYGRYRSWKATTTYGYGDGYHWRFC